MLKSQLKILSLIVFSSLIISQSYSADNSKKLDVSESAFKCISELAASGRFFVDNVLGNLDATLAIANSSSGGNYPPGSLLKLRVLKLVSVTLYAYPLVSNDQRSKKNL